MAIDAANAPAGECGVENQVGRVGVFTNYWVLLSGLKQSTNVMHSREAQTFFPLGLAQQLREF